MNIRNTKYHLIFILFLAASLRLIGIRNPLIGHHSWRQVDTAAISRNFFEEQFNILYPRIDWRRTTSGEVECEFPIYQFVVAFLYMFVGVDETAGRLLSVVFSLLAIIGMYLLAKYLSDSTVGLWSSFFMAILPISVFFGRTFMPESLLLLSCVYAVLFFTQYTATGSLFSLIISSVFLIIACLLKPPTLYLGLPLGYLDIKKYKINVLSRLELWIYATVLFASLALWFSHAHNIKQTTGLTFGVYGSDKWGNWDLVFSWHFWYEIFIKRIPYGFLSYFGIPLLILGLLRPSHSDKEKILLLWFVGMLVFIVVVAKGVFIHDYYLLPAVIPITYFMGKATAWGLRQFCTKKVRLGIVFCVIGMVAVSLLQYNKWLQKEKYSKSEAFQLAQTARLVVPKNSIVVAADGHPMILYYSHTKGWSTSPKNLSMEWVNARRNEGAKYILGVHNDFLCNDSGTNLSRLLSQHDTIFNNGHFFIVMTEKKHR